MSTRLTLSAVAAASALFFSSGASAQAKSNIADDPNSSACTENCTDAGYSWAEANTPSDDAECAAANADFAAGCAHWLEEQREAAAPPPEEPAAADLEAGAAADSAAPPAEDATDSPPADEPPADPPANQ
jgi:hypothetical protein